MFAGTPLPARCEATDGNNENTEIKKQMRVIAGGTALAYNVAVNVKPARNVVPLLNGPGLVEEAFAARTILPEEPFSTAREPITGREDLTRVLRHAPRVFVFLGNGNSALFHNSRYDFDDSGLIHGVDFHAAIAHRKLPISEPSVGASRRAEDPHTS